MAKKLEGNGFWESSRYVLPEHRDAMQEREQEQLRRGRPVIDEQQLQEIEVALIDSYNQRCEVKLVVFNPFEDEEVTGIVTVVNTYTREVKLFQGNNFRWIKVEEIIKASL
ncbi:YolD-like family protein [Paenibacillus sp. JX-17]|uniref:YolD-like family protein n=1 Tax=Paenibacillus lacisoli TaxID=3064525 RepID=A0ABT9CGM7_9BACL|nr:YolD-like family protein [Paenibacillus sp. JX-17]MDO7908407.1 YolD-like family protein [Paenibacillus sp. JX-17]